MQFAILHLSDIHFKDTDTTLYEPRIHLIVTKQDKLRLNNKYKSPCSA